MCILAAAVGAGVCARTGVSVANATENQRKTNEKQTKREETKINTGTRATKRGLATRTLTLCKRTVRIGVARARWKRPTGSRLRDESQKRAREESDAPCNRKTRADKGLTSAKGRSLAHSATRCGETAGPGFSETRVRKTIHRTTRKCTMSDPPLERSRNGNKPRPATYRPVASAAR